MAFPPFLVAITLVGLFESKVFSIMLSIEMCIRDRLKDAPIVILDEATASIDPENEAVIQQAISRLTEGKTLIVIAHRLGTVAGRCV